MTLSKQQKFDMIRDVELRIAKELLVERHVKHMNAIENSDQPMQTLKDIIDTKTPSVQEVAVPEKQSVVAGQTLREYQRDEWQDLNERHFEELKSLGPNADLKAFAAQKQEELTQLLASHRTDLDRVEKSETPLKDEQAILYSYENSPNPLTGEQKELLEQSEEAVKTPFRKTGMDSLSQWEFDGIETLAMRGAGKGNINVQEQFDNARSMSTDHDAGMER